MDLEEILKTSNLFDTKKLKIKIDSSNRFRTYNQIESIFEDYMKDNPIFSLSGNYGSTKIGIETLRRGYREICFLSQINDSVYLNFPNRHSKAIFKRVVQSFYPTI